MSQDTRKDKRAKVVSLNVRYKSATVDEFIENHSHDVSKGGIFVKTPTPFPPGTLLKFEIRLAGDKSVISGVGRVVWKREPTQAATEKPAGMGVKFIKIDDASRAVIDKLTASKPEAGSAYTSDPAALEEEKNPAAAPGPNTMREISAAEPVSTALAPETLKGPGPAPTTAAAKAAAATASTAPTAPTASGPTGTTRASTIGQKTLPLGSVPPEGLPRSTKTPSTTTAPAQTAASSPPLGASTLPSTQSPLAGASGPPAPVKMKPQTMVGVAPAANKPVEAAPAAAASTKEVAKADVPAAAPSSKPGVGGAPAPRPMAANQRKATMMGVAPAANIPAAKASEPASSSSSLDTDDTQQFIATAKPPVVETPKAPATMADAFLGGGDEKKKEPEKKAAASPMFPTSIGAEEPVKEPTMMKQAAELLEEALREAGGSMDAIGDNPLFAVANKAAAEKGSAEKSSAVASSAPGSDQSGDTVVMHKSSATPSTPPVGTAQTERQQTPPRSVPPPSSAAAPSPSSAQAARSVPPPAKPIGASIREPEKKSPMGMIIGLVAVVVVAAIIVFVVKSMGGSSGGENPAPTTSTPANTVSATPASATPSAAVPPASVSAVPAVVSAAPPPEEPKDAGKAVVAVDAGKPATPVATPAPKPKPKPKPKPTPQPEPGTEPSPSPSPAPEPAPAPAPAPEPSPSPAPEL